MRRLERDRLGSVADLVCETSNTNAVLKNTRRSSLSSPVSLSRSFTETGARIRSATSPFRTDRPSFNQVRNPAIRVGTIPRSWHCQANKAQLLAE